MSDSVVPYCQSQCPERSTPPYSGGCHKPSPTRLLGTQATAIATRGVRNPSVGQCRQVVADSLRLVSACSWALIAGFTDPRTASADKYVFAPSSRWVSTNDNHRITSIVVTQATRCSARRSRQRRGQRGDHKDDERRSSGSLLDLTPKERQSRDIDGAGMDELGDFLSIGVESQNGRHAHIGDLREIARDPWRPPPRPCRVIDQECHRWRTPRARPHVCGRSVRILSGAHGE